MIRLFQVTVKTVLLGLFIVYLIGCGGGGGESTSEGGRVYYVSPSGEDSNPGTIDQPWKTIQHAADVLIAGDTVYIRTGNYPERVIPQNSGSEGKYITYSAYPGETVTIDGDGVSVPQFAGLFHIESKNYIKVSGLRVINSTYGGIWVDTSDHVIIEKNYTYNTETSGISAWGCNNVIIDANEVERACTGEYNESISVGGTDSFEISNNYVHDVGNPDKEGICPKDGSSNGKVYGNLVHHTKVGIYVDAESKHTFNIEVYGNIVHDNAGTDGGDGIGLGCEGGGLLENVRVYNNIAYHNRFFGIRIDIYGISPTQPMQNIAVINNTAYNNGWENWGGLTWGGGIALYNPDAQNVAIRNNIVSQNLSLQLAVNTNLPAQNFSSDHNLIDGYRGDTTEGEIYGTDYVAGDPMFVNPVAADFHLQQGSPAIDAGSSLDAPNFDFDGNSRPQGAGYDIGAFEVVKK